MKTPENAIWWKEGGECDECKWSSTRVKDICTDCQRQKTVDRALDEGKKKQLERWKRE